MSRVAASFLFFAGIVHLVLGVGALTGADQLEANIREIETSPVGGDLYLSLGLWGVIFAVSAVGLLACSSMLLRKASHARVAGLSASFVAMGTVFFGLPIFRWPSVATVVLLLAAAYILTYRVQGGLEA